MRAHYPLKKVKCEVNSCIDKWKTIFEDHFDEKIEYAYAKGSGIKVWDSPIDYVPSLSDVDIHIKLRKNTSLFSTPYAAFNEAIEISGKYEKIFLEENPNPVHVPRTQIVILDRALEDPDFFLPLDPNDIQVMIGKPELRRIEDEDRIRAIDFKELLKIKGFLRTLPLKVIDKIGLDYWRLIHTLSWNVSPTPVRLLTQVMRKPEEVWGWNRTTVCRKLEEQGFMEVSRRYKEYYLSGWELFFTNFRDSKVMRKVIIKAFEVLKSSFDEVKQIKSI